MTVQVQADSASEGLDQFYDTIRYMEGKALIAIFNSNLFISQIRLIVAPREHEFTFLHSTLINNSIFACLFRGEEPFYRPPVHGVRPSTCNLQICR